MIFRGLATATESDLAEIAAMWRSSIDSVGIRYEQEESAEALLAKLRGNWPSVWTMWIVRQEATIAAFLAIDRKNAVLAQLFLSPEEQGKGLGRALLELAKSEMPGGITLWTDARNARARRFYEQNAFVLESLEKHPVASHYRAHYRWMPAPRSDRAQHSR